MYRYEQCTRDSHVCLTPQAYRSLALRLHPDKNPDKSEKGQAAYARVQKAYELLTDKAARAALDDLHRSGQCP